MLCQFLLDAVHHLQRHSITVPKFRRTIRTVKYEHSFTICRDDVDMGGAVIVHIDFHAQAIEAKDSWHRWICNLIAWVFQGAGRARCALNPISLQDFEALDDIVEPTQTTFSAEPRIS